MRDLTCEGRQKMKRKKERKKHMVPYTSINRSILYQMLNFVNI